MGQHLAQAVQSIIHKDAAARPLAALQDDVMIDIYTAEMAWIGSALRKPVHQLGLWHKSDHCWFYSCEGGKAYLWIQMRSANKAVFPGMLEVTAGRHLLSGETDRDGISKISTELGVELGTDAPQYLGVRANKEQVGEFVNHEFNSVYLYRSPYALGDFSPNPQEAAGILRAEATALAALLAGERDTAESVGLFVEGGGRHVREHTIRAADFVPRTDDYYARICASVISLCGGGEATGI